MTDTTRIRAHDLNGTHLGHPITLKGDGWAIAGALWSVNHDADQSDVWGGPDHIAEVPGRRTQTPGRTTTDIRVGPFAGTISSNIMCTVATED